MNMKEEMDPRAQRTEEQILKAFDELLREKELSRITVTDLTKRAGICRKTFYLHYSSIDNLVDEIIQGEMKDIAERLSAVPLEKDGSFDVSRLLNALGEGILMSFSRRTELVKYINTDRLINRLKPMLTASIAQKDALGLAGSLGPYLDTFVAFFCAGILAVYHQWVLSDEKLPMENVSTLAGAAVAGGLAALSSEAAALGVTRVAGTSVQ